MTPSGRGYPAVHADRLSGQARRAGAAQEHHQRGEVVRLGHAQMGQRGRLFEEVLAEAIPEHVAGGRGARDQRWRDDVHPDPVALGLDGGHPGEHDDGGHGPTEHALPGRGHLGGVRGDVDDASAALFSHDRQHGAGQVHRRQRLGEQDGRDIGHRGPVQEFGPVGPGHGADQDIDGAERLVSFGDGGLYLPGVAGVGRDEHHVRIRAMPGDRLPGGLPAVLVAGQQGQPPDPGVSERQGAGQVLPQVAPADMIQVQYTSGTTGFPKGAVLHHMGLVNEATFVAERAGMNDGGVCVNAMPIYHIGGGAVTSFGTWAKRGPFVILPGFEPGLLLEAFEAYSGTHTLVVPTMLIAMLDHPDLAKRDLSSLQTIMSGAASVPASLVRKTIGLLGCQFSILFGQTETHGVISQTRVTDTPEDQAGTVGQPLPRLEVKIADMMTGGWLHMGDIGSMDERGFLRVTSRVKDMIIRGGMNLVLRRRAFTSTSAATCLPCSAARTSAETIAVSSEVRYRVCLIASTFGSSAAWVMNASTEVVNES